VRKQQLVCSGHELYKHWPTTKQVTRMQSDVSLEPALDGLQLLAGRVDPAPTPTA
jgi:hypothetical protein